MCVSISNWSVTLESQFCSYSTSNDCGNNNISIYSKYNFFLKNKKNMGITHWLIHVSPAMYGIPYQNKNKNC